MDSRKHSPELAEMINDMAGKQVRVELDDEIAKDPRVQSALAALQELHAEIAQAAKALEDQKTRFESAQATLSTMESELVEVQRPDLANDDWAQIRLRQVATSMRQRLLDRLALQSRLLRKSYRYHTGEWPEGVPDEVAYYGLDWRAAADSDLEAVLSGGISSQDSLVEETSELLKKRRDVAGRSYRGLRLELQHGYKSFSDRLGESKSANDAFSAKLRDADESDWTCERADAKRGKQIPPLPAS